MTTITHWIDPRDLSETRSLQFLRGSWLVATWGMLGIRQKATFLFLFVINVYVKFNDFIYSIISKCMLRVNLEILTSINLRCVGDNSTN